MLVRIINNFGMNSMNIVNIVRSFNDSIIMNSIFIVSSVGMNSDFCE